MNSVEDPLQARMGQKMTCVQGMTKRGNTCLDWEPNRERSTRVKSPVQTLNGEIRDIRDLIKVRGNFPSRLFFFLAKNYRTTNDPTNVNL